MTCPKSRLTEAFEGLPLAEVCDRFGIMNALWCAPESAPWAPLFRQFIAGQVEHILTNVAECKPEPTNRLSLARLNAEHAVRPNDKLTNISWAAATAYASYITFDRAEYRRLTTEALTQQAEYFKTLLV
jgi:hypothetical protein